MSVLMFVKAQKTISFRFYTVSTSNLKHTKFLHWKHQYSEQNSLLKYH